MKTLPPGSSENVAIDVNETTPNATYKIDLEQFAGSLSTNWSEALPETLEGTGSAFAGSNTDSQ